MIIPASSFRSPERFAFCCPRFAWQLLTVRHSLIVSNHLHHASSDNIRRVVAKCKWYYGCNGGDRVKNTRRSGCPINLTIEMLGDHWSLIVIRDVMFGNRRHYGDLLRLSEEGIASNILANRLTHLVNAGLLSRREDPTHKQKAIYSLTEASIQLVPLLAHMGAWGRRHTPASKELAIRARLLEEGGERMWKAFMAELRSIHLGTPAPRRSVFAELQAAFESSVRRQTNTGNLAPSCR
jgi:DNA-binding HxlR family transcriptional regulator